MKNLLLICLTCGFIYLLSCAQPGEPTATTETENAAPTHEDSLKRGEYLVNAVGCDDCHSPKRMGAQGPEVIPETRFSGYPADRPFDKATTSIPANGWITLNPDLTCAVGPWGVSFAANLTSDETGVGNWTTEQFIRCIREGKLKGLESGRPLLPPMPWHVYRNFTDEDLASILIYLKSTKPVKNVVPAPIPPDQLAG